MFERRGREDGGRDGFVDAGLRMPPRPRPNLALAVIAAGYRDSYLSAYRDAHQTRTWQEDRRRADLARKQTGTKLQASPEPKRQKTDAAFDRGWRDGMSGKDPAPAGRSTDPHDADAYARGYKIGERDRDYERARRLRAKTTPHNSRQR